MNYVQKHLTRQRFYEHEYSDTYRIFRRIYFHIHYIETGGYEQEKGRRELGGGEETN